MGFLQFLRNRFQREECTRSTPRVTLSTRVSNDRTSALSSNRISADNAVAPPPREPLLFTLARDGSWDAVIVRCRTYPSEMAWRDSDHNTLLHIILVGRPPLAVIEAVLAETGMTLLTANSNGCVPLHHACRYRCSVEVVERLVQADDDPIACVVPGTGFTPLHSLCNTSVAPDVMRVVLLRAVANGLWKETVGPDHVFGRTPLDWVRSHQNLRQQQTSLERLKSLRQQQRVLLSSDQGEDTEVVDWPEHSDLTCELVDRLEEEVAEYRDGPFWECLSLLLVFEHQGTVVESSSSSSTDIIRACFALHKMEEWAVLLYEPAFRESRHDFPDGKSPLHWSASRRDEGVINLILSVNPQLAALRDSEGRTPLQHWYESFGGMMPIQHHPLSLIEANPLGFLDSKMENVDVDAATVCSELSLDGLFTLVREGWQIDRFFARHAPSRIDRG